MKKIKYLLSFSSYPLLLESVITEAILIPILLDSEKKKKNVKTNSREKDKDHDIS